MSNLEYLVVTRNFQSYYRTLRDVNYYLGSHEGLPSASEVITRLIFKFINTEGTTFREMDRDLYERKYEMFEQDFLAIIQNSGENDLDFEEFSILVEDLLRAANLRTETLGKMKNTNKAEVMSAELEAVIANLEENEPIEEEKNEESSSSDEFEESSEELEESSEELEESSEELEESSEEAEINVEAIEEDLFEKEVEIRFENSNDDYRPFKRFR